jgi:hypothetical protein
MGRRSGLILGLLAAILSPGLAVAVPMTPEGELQNLGVNCVIDGIPLRCVIDTGDNATATLPTTPLTAKLPVIGKGGSIGASGVMVPTDYVKVQAIHAGNITVTQPTDVVRTARPENSAVLGRGFFQATITVTFDFRTMNLTADGPAGAVCPGAFHVAAFMEVPAEFDSKAIQAGWDTGAGLTMVDTAFVARHPELFNYLRDFPAIDATTGRSLPAKVYSTSALSLCGHKINNLTVQAVDFSPLRTKAPDVPDVVFGNNLFAGHVWAFDFSDGRWSVN